MKHPDDMSNAELIVWQEGRIKELERQLSRYQGGVEVEGMAVKYADVFPSKFVSCNFPDELIGQKVRVLVVPEERVVDGNKTMKEVE